MAAGLAVPALVSGRATMAVLGAMALAAVLATPGLGVATGMLGRAARSAPGLALAALLGAWLVSVVLSFDPWVSFQVWVRVPLLVGAAGLIACRLAAGPIDLAAKALIAGTALAAALALAGATVAPDLIALVRAKAPGWAAHDAAAALKGFGSALACLMPVALWFGRRAGGAWRLAGLAVQPLAIGAMIAVDSRAGLAGAALALLTVATGAASRRLAVALVMAIVAGGAAVAILAGAGPLGAPFAMLDPHRAAIWRAALAYLPGAPVFGHGPDVINLLPGADVLVPGFGQARIPSHPHDWAVEVLVETGAVGLILLLAVLVLVVARLGRLEPGAARAGLGLMAAFWGSGLVNFSLWAAWWQGVLLLPLALVLAAGTTGRTPAGSSAAAPAAGGT